MGQREFYDGLKGQSAVDQEWADGASFFTGFMKEAYSSPIPCGSIGDAPQGWLGQFEGTPLHQQAVALEREELRMQSEDLARRQQERQKNEGMQQLEQQRWDFQDQLRIKKRELELQLAESRVGGAAGGEMEAQGGGQEMPELLADAGAEMQDPAAATVDPAAAIKTAGVFDGAKELLAPHRAIPLALGAAIGGGIGHAKFRGRKELGGKSHDEVESSNALSAQQADGVDEDRIGFIKKVLRRSAEARPGIAKALRQHPLAAIGIGAAAGASAGNAIGRGAQLGYDLIKKGPIQL